MSQPSSGRADASTETSHGYQYVVLRCVPRVDREEFVNIGVVLYCQSTDFLCSASHVVPERVRALAEDVDLTSVADSLAGIEALCCGSSPLATTGLVALGQRFGWLAAPKSTVVQPGPIHGGLTSDPARQLERLLEVLVR
ncbi:DUF3037 domain-containing protein [Jatrophihabitans telluris]|uniref:DUF3037 domain-containing protein n=1 Tax=Jatrophihabitans telluris TaxID=2038343 RepID=A0ABY4R358_9ACTN|nr:DUF3037 domain-containing protein [Jatrophihabitans telluris]UQX90229.1 DUF3037 domain-containing protein [Jatrophihabitans telluris]